MVLPCFPPALKMGTDPSASAGHATLKHQILASSSKFNKVTQNPLVGGCALFGSRWVRVTATDTLSKVSVLRQTPCFCRPQDGGDLSWDLWEQSPLNIYSKHLLSMKVHEREMFSVPLEKPQNWEKVFQTFPSAHVRLASPSASLDNIPGPQISNKNTWANTSLQK